MWQEITNQSMARFVKSHQLFFKFTDYPAFLLRTGNNPVNSFFHFICAYNLFVPAGCQQGGLVHQVLYIRAGKAGCSPGQNLKIDIGCQGLPFNMNF